MDNVLETYLMADVEGDEDDAGAMVDPPVEGDETVPAEPVDDDEDDDEEDTEDDGDDEETEESPESEE